MCAVMRCRWWPALAGVLVVAGCGDEASVESEGVDAQRVERDAAADAGVSEDSGQEPGTDAVAGESDARVDLDGEGAPRQDAATSDTGGTTDTGAARRFTGGVTLFEVRAPGIDALNTGGVAAGFREWTAPAPAERVATVGDCFVTAVAPDSNPFPDEPTLDGGAVTVVTAGETFTLTVTATADGPRYAGGTTEGRSDYYAGGETVTVSSAGGADVPAISGSVVTPEEPVITSPSWSLGSSHSRSEDLSVAWTGASTGAPVFVNVLPVRIFPDPGIAEGNSITCEVSDSGSMTVPASALAYLPEGGLLGGASVALTVVRSVSSPTNGAGVDVVVNATASHTVIGSID